MSKMPQNCLYGIRALAALFLCTSLLLLATPSLADTPPLTPVDFTGFTGAGFAPSPAAGQLDSDSWRVTGLSDGAGSFGGTHTSGDFARGPSTGGVTTGGVYGFDVGSGNRILGVQPTGDDFTPGTITLKIQNTTGAMIANLYVSYTIWTYNDQGRSNSLNFSYSLDDSSYTSVAALNFTTPQAADGSPAWTNTARSTTLTGINLADNASVYLRWTGDDVGGSGSRDEYGIDDVEVRVSDATALTLRAMDARTAGGGAALPLLALTLAGGVAAAGARVAGRRR